MVELDAIRVAALGNNAPVSFGALGAPIIALSAVTKVPLDQLSALVGRIVAILALLAPWILILLRYWRPRETLGFGGVPVAEEKINSSRTNGGEPPPHTAGSPARPTAPPAVMLGYLILIALFYRGVLPAAMQP